MCLSVHSGPLGVLTCGSGVTVTLGNFSLKSASPFSAACTIGLVALPHVLQRSEIGSLLSVDCGSPAEPGAQAARSAVVPAPNVVRAMRLRVMGMSGSPRAPCVGHSQVWWLAV